MNHLTPLSIRRQEFRKNIRGYDVDEVNNFMEILANEFERLLKQNEELTSGYNELNRKLMEYQQIEKGLQQTLLSAQEQSSKSLEASKRQAMLIVKEAEVKATAIIENAKHEAKKITDAVAGLKTEKESLVQKLKAIVSAQMQLLDSFTYGEGARHTEHTTDKKDIQNIIEKIL